MTSRAAAAQIVRTALALRAQRVLPGTLGNISMRLDARRVVITPSSRPYETMRAEDLPVVALADGVAKGPFPPSVETPMHCAIYRARPDVHAIVHTHAPAATAVGCLGMALPLQLDEVEYYVGGAVPLAPYAPSGSTALAANVVAALGRRNAALMTAHGLITVAPDLAKAQQIAEAIEHAAQVFLMTRRAAGM
jgi:L-fuculose-phosphate aldolase